ncbi:hypothetical protein M446_2039 [Methylobacterium sp. 4-46]|uniref:hypothetical protein n=1 Tax=unclassified Methylobacterium TaxID=2615210 RepID=UPI000165C6E5|nr:MULTISPECIES: hypothetical protein [Methylobacterium]ACA16503.1 hypothetical protein M446_2039 [Methylobacterium sp. 4-46]WFT82212.1 hypothetical protein QA634_10335 [Methylobacterium nodulans]
MLSSLRCALALTASLLAAGPGPAAAQASSCPPGYKVAAGACVRSCPGGFEDTGRACVFRSMGR